jgi:hypothetical protein
MEAMTMRTMMIAASLLFAACGTVQGTSNDVPGDEGTGGDGSGDTGSGSGGGMDAGVPSRCMTAADCGGGKACDVSTHECVMGMLTIQPSADMAVDGNRWWVATSSPIVRGTFQGPTAAVIQVQVNGTGTVATLQGSSWTVQLPVGSIGATDTWIRVMMTDPSGGLVELMQLLVLDNAAPQISLQPSKVRDERGDTIDFATGEPIHTHAGAEIDLAAACPSIYRYAYLMHATPPLYGRSAAPNPLAWNLTVADTKLDPASRAFRVRTDANQTLLDWTALPAPDAVGVHRIELTRTGGAYPIAALGTRTGTFYIDVRARDWNGLEANISYCFDNHPLAVPLQIDSIEEGALFGMSLPADSRLAPHLNIGGIDIELVSQRIVQQTAEPVTLSWSATAGEIRYAKTAFYDYVAETLPEGMLCSHANACRTWAPAPIASPLTTQSGVIPSNRLHVVVRDEVSGTIVAQSASLSLTWQVPARASSQSPRAYRISVVSAPLFELLPASLDLWSSFPVVTNQTLQGKTYIGPDKTAAGSGCASVVETAFGLMCAARTIYWNVSALDHAQLDIAGFAASMQIDGEPPSYTPTSNLTSGTLTWDSGDDDLPGAY